MLIALDTATQTASIAIYDVETNQLLAEWSWLARRKQTQDLLSTAERMMQQLDVLPSALTAIAVTTGPGSFTGVRIAISAAKGIGVGLPDVPQVIGLPTLSVTAAPWLSLLAGIAHKGQFRPLSDQIALICPYIQAGRGRYNWALVSNDTITDIELWTPGKEEHCAGDVDRFVNFLTELAPKTCMVVGETDTELDQRVKTLQHVNTINQVSGLRRAGELARLAVKHLAAGHAISLSRLEPLYLRNP